VTTETEPETETETHNETNTLILELKSTLQLAGRAITNLPSAH
jgi:hypothetical protein